MSEDYNLGGPLADLRNLNIVKLTTVLFTKENHLKLSPINNGQETTCRLPVLKMKTKCRFHWKETTSYMSFTPMRKRLGKCTLEFKLV